MQFELSKEKPTGEAQALCIACWHTKKKNELRVLRQICFESE